MYKKGDKEIVYSASDLMLYMDSPFACWMNRLSLEGLAGEIEKDPQDAMMGMLASKGDAHELAFRDQLLAQGLEIAEIAEGDRTSQERATVDAMRAGVEVIFQARLAHDQFAGYADFLVRVVGESSLGDYHYSVWDTKLAKKAKPYFAIQLCCYAEMLEAIQGILPDEVAIALSSTDPQGHPDIYRLRTLDYFYFYRQLKSCFLADQANFIPEQIPDPADSKTFGDWSTYASQLLEARDDLSLVANITKTQIKRLKAAGIETLTSLAKSEFARVPKMDPAMFNRLRRQANIQLRSRGLEIPAFEVNTQLTRATEGLSLLPPHSPADVYWDLEGYPLMDGGLEYLWGACYHEHGENRFVDWWAHDHEQEQAAFEAFIDWAYSRWKADPSMHIYHYGHYEVDVLRRLMGRCGSREFEVDQLLRNNVLVDLYPIVRKGMFVGEPAYSIKNIEHIYRGRRDTDVVSGGESVVVYEQWRDTPDGDTWEHSAILKSIRDYNIDDCESTLELVEWLRVVQKEHRIDYLGPPAADEAAQEGPVTTEAGELAAQLLQHAEGEPNDAIIKTLAWSLEFHKREAKPGWWKFFDWMDSTAEDLYDELDCLAGLVRTDRLPYKLTERKRKKCYEYNFDTDQDTKIQAGSSVFVISDDKPAADVIEFDGIEGRIILESSAELDSTIDLCPNSFVPAKVIERSILDFVSRWHRGDIRQNAVVDFLDKRAPRLKKDRGGPLLNSRADVVQQAIGLASDLDSSLLCIQGPPGTGKTYTGSHIITSLLEQGSTVGVMSHSHKAVLNLMVKTVDLLEEKKLDFGVLKIGGGQEDALFDNPRVGYRQSASDFTLPEHIKLVGGSAWAFASESFIDELDYLFIDEAGQVSIANLIGVGRSTKNIILLGDQMQLSQPIQGSHPGESGKSCLEYFLGDHSTIPADMGVFLPETRRMHPDVCQVVSDMVYEGRLQSHESTKSRVIANHELLPSIEQQAGIQFLPVSHEGNTQSSEEEVDRIVELVQELSKAKLKDTDLERSVDLEDILFITPYNAQVNKLKDALPAGAKVGSVDKFQGQEAPIVIISMCASNAGESPRGIGFIFNRNRLNVALSRAETLVLVIGSPDLANTPISNLEQMSQVNSFCWLASSKKCSLHQLIGNSYALRFFNKRRALWNWFRFKRCMMSFV